VIADLKVDVIVTPALFASSAIRDLRRTPAPPHRQVAY
jgi:hypothetical protein